MAFKTLTMECLSNCLSDSITMRVKRFDGMILDPQTLKFQPSSYFTNTSNCLFLMTYGQGLDEWIASISFQLDTSQFLDGDYMFYFYNSSGKCFEGSKISIYGGDSHVPNPTDIALRIMNAQGGTGTFRDAIIKVNQSSKL